MQRIVFCFILAACSSESGSGFYFQWDPSTNLNAGEFHYEIGPQEAGETHDLSWESEPREIVEISHPNATPNGVFILEGYGMADNSIVTPCPDVGTEQIIVEYDNLPAEMVMSAESSDTNGISSCYMVFSY